MWSSFSRWFQICKPFWPLTLHIDAQEGQSFRHFWPIWLLLLTELPDLLIKLKVTKANWHLVLYGFTTDILVKHINKTLFLRRFQPKTSQDDCYSNIFLAFVFTKDFVRNGGKIVVTLLWFRRPWWIEFHSEQFSNLSKIWFCMQKKCIFLSILIRSYFNKVKTGLLF